MKSGTRYHSPDKNELTMAEACHAKGNLLFLSYDAWPKKCDGFASQIKRYTPELIAQLLLLLYLNCGILFFMCYVVGTATIHVERRNHPKNRFPQSKKTYNEGA
jgi:hypothetical protein